MELIKRGFYECKNSKFYSYLYEINSFEEYKQILEEVSKKHKKANHLCYFLRYGDSNHFSNDGEVGGPAKFMNFYLEQNDLNSHMIVVARVFGGVKLGVGGVSRSFREAVKDLK